MILFVLMVFIICELEASKFTDTNVNFLNCGSIVDRVFPISIWNKM